MADESLSIRAIKIALGDNGALEWADEYGEPGYGPAEKGVLLANWNRAEDAIKQRWMARQLSTRGPAGVHEEQCANLARLAWRALESRLEAQGYALEWSDEWMIDYDNGSKCYRTQPDSHGWEPRVMACDGFYLTPECDAQDWIDECVNEDTKPLPSWFDGSELTTRGFVQWEQDDKQVGFHPGQNDTPDKFTPALRAEGYDYLLKITGRGQFDVHYEVWTRKEATRGVLFDSASGIYIPQRFAKEIDRSRVTGVDAETWEILEAGPDHDSYWDVWDEVLDGARLTMDNGTVVVLEQDGDVFYRDASASYCEYLDTYYTHKA